MSIKIVPRRCFFIALLLLASRVETRADSSSGPHWSGTLERGSVTMPLYRGAAVPFELTVVGLPGDCEREMTLELEWDKSENRVKVALRGKAALEPFPTVDRTPGVNYFPNPFFPEPEDVVNGRYQLWLISAAGPIVNFYYDPMTLDLLGSAQRVGDPPPFPAIPVGFPTLYMFSTPLFQPDEDGNVDFEWEFDYDGAVRGDRPEFGHHLVTFPPPNLAFVNPFRLDQSWLRPYIDDPVPGSEARPWSDYLRGGLLFDVTIEPADYHTEPPLTTLTATYSGATAIPGGIPRGWTFWIDAAFSNVAPAIRPWAGRDSCDDFYEMHAPNLTLSLDAETGAASPRATGDAFAPSFGEGAGLFWGYGPRVANNFHLESIPRFQPIQPGADAMRGQALFGLAEDGVSEDTSEALFEGFSAPFGGEVVSNGRTCFTCHRGPETEFGLPPTPISDHVSLDDTLFTEIDADTGGDPDGFHNLDAFGLVKYKINRFNQLLSPDDPLRQVFAWRKTPKLTNVGFSQGFLTDGRGRVMFETARGAVFSHTQGTDGRFDDLFSVADGNDLEAFMFGLFSDPALEALRDPSHPDHAGLVERPYTTVELSTRRERRGLRVFHRNCFTCHNTPNVFSNLANVEPTGNGERPVDFPSWAPPVGRMFNVGVSERNTHGLRFSRHVGVGSFQTIVVPLAGEDGSVHEFPVEFDIGLAVTTGRLADVGRFKVPQLRNLEASAPYFHDNSAATIEEAVDYFLSRDYRRSRDGRFFPIAMTSRERRALIAFLKKL